MGGGEGEDFGAGACAGGGLGEYCGMVVVGEMREEGRGMGDGKWMGMGSGEKGYEDELEEGIE